MRTPLEEDILRTVLWFSLFEYPLTSFEIWKWMLGASQQWNLGEVVAALATAKELQHALQEENGVFFLRDGTASAQIRRERFSNATRKMNRLVWVVRYLKLIPFVRGVAVCNTLSWMHTRKESDIDLFVIVKEGSLWTTRLLAVLPFKMLRSRPGERKEDPICFSFFLSDTSLNLETLALQGDDPYLAYWSKAIIPLFDRDDVFLDFQKANTWIGTYLAHAYARPFLGEGTRSVRAPHVFEQVTSRLQRRAFPETITQMANRDSRVVVSPAMLKFHANDRRELFRDRFHHLCEAHELTYGPI